MTATEVRAKRRWRNTKQSFEDRIKELEAQVARLTDERDCAIAERGVRGLLRVFKKRARF